MNHAFLPLCFARRIRQPAEKAHFFQSYKDAIRDSQHQRERVDKILFILQSFCKIG
jgi:hypothetical protein